LTIIRDAIEAVQRNLGALLIYLAFVLPPGLVTLAWGLLKEQERLDTLNPALRSLCEVAIDLGFVLLVALGQSIAFSMMGREIDRPMWRISGPVEALRRYFGLWFVFALAGLASARLASLLAGRQPDGPFAGLVFLLYLVISLATVPIGAGLMFQGRISINNWREGVAPLFRQFLRTLVLVGMNLFSFALFIAIYTPERSVLMTMVLGAVVFIIGAYFDCVVFAGIWLICMIDRDTTEEPDIEF